MRSRWVRIRGGPSARQGAFDQARAVIGFDRHVGEVLARIETLILGHGVFHAQVHFSIGPVTLWMLSDPKCYRVHVKEEFLDPDFALAYPRLPFTPDAVVPSPEIPKVLAEFARLRMPGRHIHLRSGSLNVVNGLVGLNFSCEVSHYLSYAEFFTRARDLYA